MTGRLSFARPDLFICATNEFASLVLRPESGRAPVAPKPPAERSRRVRQPDMLGSRWPSHGLRNRHLPAREKPRFRALGALCIFNAYRIRLIPGVNRHRALSEEVFCASGLIRFGDMKSDQLSASLDFPFGYRGLIQRGYRPVQVASRAVDTCECTSGLIVLGFDLKRPTRVAGRFLRVPALSGPPVQFLRALPLPCPAHYQC